MTSPVVDATPTPLTRPESVRGRFLWYDLMVPDVDAATRFYPPITGWTLAPWPMGDGVAPYTMWANGAMPVGGVMATPPDAAGASVAGSAPGAYWLAYIGTPDVDATFSEALALGGQRVVAPTDIPDVGRFAVLADPQGAAFAIFRPTTPSVPRGSMPEAGEFSWHELATTDHVAAFAFYSTLFGWAPTESMDMGSSGVYQMFGQPGATYGGMFDGTREGLPPHWLLYVYVRDLEAALDAVRVGGGQVRRGPMPIPGGRVAHCADAQGAHFALHTTE